MRCVKCAAEITAVQCPHCGFDHIKSKVRFLSPPPPKQLRLVMPSDATSVVSVLNEAQKRNAESLVNVLKEAKDKQIQEKTAVTSDGMFEIYDGKVLRRYNGSEANVIVPSYVKHIAQGAFGGKDFCRTISLPEGLESIGSVAFEKCSELETINLPQGLKDIGIRTFYDCQKLKQIEIPGSVTFICSQAFGGCTALENVVFQDGIKKVDTDIFGGCSSLKTIHVPDSVQEIRAARGGRLTQRIWIYASEKWVREQASFFRQNPNYIPAYSTADGLRISGDRLCSYSGKQAHVVIPSGITEIADYAFSHNFNIRTIELPEGLQEIWWSAFSGCYNLKEIRLPQTVRKIYENAFHDTGISRIELPAGLTYVAKGAFGNGQNLKEIVLQEGITDIHMDSFEGCRDLQKIIVPDSLETIWDIDVLKGYPNNIQIVASRKWLSKHKSYLYNSWRGFRFDASDAPEKLSPEEQYQQGRECEENNNLVIAESWYRMAAERGHADAQNRLGRILDNKRSMSGRQSPEDLAQAAYWYQKAAEQGHTSAQYNLACCYAEGRGVKKDLSMAFRYYSWAAHGADAHAQWKLSECYEKGLGVKKDLSQAILWLERACDNGISQRSHLSELRSRARSLFPWRR